MVPGRRRSRCIPGVPRSPNIICTTLHFVGFALPMILPDAETHQVVTRFRVWAMDDLWAASMHAPLGKTYCQSRIMG
jgi:hypothetical protein